MTDLVVPVTAIEAWNAQARLILEKGAESKDYFHGYEYATKVFLDAAEPRVSEDDISIIAGAITRTMRPIAKIEMLPNLTSNKRSPQIVWNRAQLVAVIRRALEGADDG